MQARNKPLRTVILLPKMENNVLAIIGAHKFMEAANEIGGPYFHIQWVSTSSEPMIRTNRFLIANDSHYSQINEVDLIIVPSLHGDMEEVISENQCLIDWISHRHRTGKTEVASMCTGAYFLAEAGLLDGLEASSHWTAVDDIKKKYVDVQWVPEKIVTDRNGIYTSGGALSSYNLILYIIEKHLGREVAFRVAQLFEVDYPRSSQLPYMAFNNQKRHQDEQILEVQEFLEKNVSSALTVSELAEKFAMSHRNFIRRFKKATHNTPYQYIQRLRIEAAKKLLVSTNLHVNEVMNEVGYSDPLSFRLAFKKISGFTPHAYRDKYVFQYQRN